MKICGLKLTHDGAIAVIDNQKLVFNIELEKLNNNPRYISIEDTTTIKHVLNDNGYELSDIDCFSVDGWGGYDQDALAIQPRLKIGELCNTLSVLNNGTPFQLNIAPYTERTLEDSVLKPWNFTGLAIGDRTFSYQSYLHVTNHIIGAYCTSPFAQRKENAFILVWDGGMLPRLYYFNSQTNEVNNLGPIFLLVGNIYTIFSQHFGPFKVHGNFAKDDLSVAGKVMAYIALGEVRPELFDIFDDIYHQHYDKPMGFANQFAQVFKKRIQNSRISDEDILRTFHAYLENLLIVKLKKKISRFNKEVTNLCLVGGCALNIKWNSAIRDSGIFQNVYVPPFPNDSGSAIGAACAAMLNLAPETYVDWNVYSGPQVLKSKDVGPEWTTKKCTVDELATILYENDEPVVFLNGRAELGPRALGNRSILAPRLHVI